jgi:hypothetical protein
VNPGDPRQASDVELFEQWLEGRVRESDPRVDDLFHRRPQWRELSDLASDRSDGERAPPWAGLASESDRRLVAECFAQARAHRPSIARDTSGPAREGSTTKRWPRWLLALAALLVVSWVARMWWLGERTPDRKSGELLGTNAQVDSLEAGVVAPDFSSFAWKDKSPESGSEGFVLTIWAADPSRARGQWLFTSDKTRETHVTISREKRESWPDEVIWRVDRVDSSGVSTPGPEWRAQRTAR